MSRTRSRYEDWFDFSSDGRDRHMGSDSFKGPQNKPDPTTLTAPTTVTIVTTSVSTPEVIVTPVTSLPRDMISKSATPYTQPVSPRKEGFLATWNLGRKALKWEKDHPKQPLPYCHDWAPALRKQEALDHRAGRSFRAHLDLTAGTIDPSGAVIPSPVAPKKTQSGSFRSPSASHAEPETVFELQSKYRQQLADYRTRLETMRKAAETAHIAPHTRRQLDEFESQLDQLHRNLTNWFTHSTIPAQWDLVSGRDENAVSMAEWDYLLEDFSTLLHDSERTMRELVRHSPLDLEMQIKAFRRANRKTLAEIERSAAQISSEQPSKTLQTAIDQAKASIGRHPSSTEPVAVIATSIVSSQPGQSPASPFVATVPAATPVPVDPTTDPTTDPNTIPLAIADTLSNFEKRLNYLRSVTLPYNHYAHQQLEQLRDKHDLIKSNLRVWIRDTAPDSYYQGLVVPHSALSNKVFSDLRVLLRDIDSLFDAANDIIPPQSSPPALIAAIREFARDNETHAAALKDLTKVALQPTVTATSTLDHSATATLAANAAGKAQNDRRNTILASVRDHQALLSNCELTHHAFSASRSSGEDEFLHESYLTDDDARGSAGDSNDSFEAYCALSAQDLRGRNADTDEELPYPETIRWANDSWNYGSD